MLKERSRSQGKGYRGKVNQTRRSRVNNIKVGHQDTPKPGSKYAVSLGETSYLVAAFGVA